MKIQITIAAIIATCAQTAHADVCSPYMGQVVAAKDIDDVMAPFRAVGQKGEFETTTQYEARKQEAIVKLGSVLIVKKEPEDRKYLIYDADSQRLSIISYAFDNLGFNSEALFGYDAPFRGVVDAGLANIDVLIKEEDSVTGSYEASNSYGAKTVVQKIFRRTRGIFQSKASLYASSLFPAAEVRPYYAGSISMTPENAMKLKPTLQLAFVVIPKAPFFLSALYEGPSRPTITRPREVKSEVSALIGDIQCGLVLDTSNTVLGAFETR